MLTETLPTIKKELQHKSSEELLELCLRLSKFKKENKELMSYLLFMEADIPEYIIEVKKQINKDFAQINNNNYYLIKKSVRKILRYAKKQIRFTLKKEVAVEVLIHFCLKMKTIRPSISNNKMLSNIYDRQIAAIQKDISTLHEDLQYDYQQKLDAL
ncbi:MAG: hypothetical protein ACJAT1_000505 [Marivirga sp.]|jgi:hypothetical protein